jgi:hypothetical protein
MPRTGKGGARQGAEGTAYSNRTDLNVPKMTVPGQEYGMAGQQMAAQSAVPMGSAPMPQIAAPAPQAQAGPMPGSLPHLESTQRPNEPVTAGLPFGPGPGPEVLANQAGPNSPVGATFDALSKMPNVPSSVSAIAEASRLLGL